MMDVVPRYLSCDNAARLCPKMWLDYCRASGRGIGRYEILRWTGGISWAPVNGLRMLSMPLGFKLEVGKGAARAQVVITYDIKFIPMATIRVWDAARNKWRFRGWNWTWSVTMGGYVRVFDFWGDRVHGIDHQLSDFLKRIAHLNMTDRCIHDAPPGIVVTPPLFDATQSFDLHSNEDDEDQWQIINSA